MGSLGRNVWIIGAHTTRFGRRIEDGFKDLCGEALHGALADAGLADGHNITSISVSNSGMGGWGQSSIRGQICLEPQFANGLLRVGTPVTNVENACAGGATALRQCVLEVVSGQAHLALALGVEKLNRPKDAPQTFEGFMGGIDALDPGVWKELYRAAAESVGRTFEIAPDRSVFMDLYAIRALHYMRAHAITVEQLAVVAAKNHTNGSLNPRAQYRFTLSIEEVLADRVVSAPFTRAMCAPVSDGAAACLLASDEALMQLPVAVQERAVRLRSIAIQGALRGGPCDPGASHIAARVAYAQAGLGPDDIDVAEVHDATVFSEIFQSEMMGFCPPGQGGLLAARGETGPGGRIPINMSGGLISKGHPIGATGLSMICELVEQLRGEAGPRQVPGAHVGLAENGGGISAFDEAVACVALLSRA